MAPEEPRNELLYPGKNGIETSVAITDVLSGFSGMRRTMERETVKEIFRRLNAGEVQYALIGGLACAEYAPPRATQDVDIVVFRADVSRVRALFPGSYVRGTAIAGIYDFQGTRLDVQPARRGVQVRAIHNAVDRSFEGEPVKVVDLRDLVLLKLWASTERQDPLKSAQDSIDAAELLRHNAGTMDARAVAGIANDLLGMAYTAEDAAKQRRAIAWLNETLDKLGLGDRKFPLEERKEP